MYAKNCLLFGKKKSRMWWVHCNSTGSLLRYIFRCFCHPCTSKLIWPSTSKKGRGEWATMRPYGLIINKIHLFSKCSKFKNSNINSKINSTKVPLQIPPKYILQFMTIYNKNYSDYYCRCNRSVDKYCINSFLQVDQFI